MRPVVHRLTNAPRVTGMSHSVDGTTHYRGQIRVMLPRGDCAGAPRHPTSSLRKWMCTTVSTLCIPPGEAPIGSIKASLRYGAYFSRSPQLTLLLWALAVLTRMIFIGCGSQENCRDLIFIASLKLLERGPLYAEHCTETRICLAPLISRHKLSS